MIKKSKKTFILLLLFAIFAMVSFAKNTYAQTLPEPGSTDSTMHDCKKNTQGKWVCTYQGVSYEWNVNQEGKVEGTRFGSCEPLPNKLNEMMGSCLFCDLFLTLFNSVQSISTNSFNKIAPNLKIVMALGFAIWLAIVLLPTLSSMGKQDAPKFIKDILAQSFKVAICFILLSNPTYIYTWIIDTILIAGMDFSNSFLFDVDTSQITATTGIASINPGVIGSNVYIELDKLLQALQQQLGFLLAMGSSTACLGITGLKIGMALNGLVVYFLSLILLITFGFYLTDAIIQLAIVGALMPLLIATYPFKITAQYAKKGFEILMNSFFMFLIIGVVITIDVKLILQAMTMGNTDGAGDAKAEIFKAFSQNDVDLINNLFDITLAGGVGLIACIIIAFKFTNQSASIADKYSGGALIKAMGSSIATIGASFATNALKRTTQPARQLMAKPFNKLATKAGDKIGDGISAVGGAAAKYSGAKWLANKVEQGVVGVGAVGLKGVRAVGNARRSVGRSISNSKIVQNTRDAMGLDTNESKKKNLEEKIDKGDKS